MKLRDAVSLPAHLRCFLRTVPLVLFLLLPWSATADDKTEQNLAYTPPPPPKILRHQKRLPDYLLYHKRQGFFITGFPIIGQDPDTGFNIGASLQLYWDRTREDPFFAYTPYAHCLKVAAQGSPSTGYQLYNVTYDAPNFYNTPFGISAVARFERWLQHNYYGLGTDSLLPLTDPATGQTFTRLSDYWKAIGTVRNGVVYTNYNYYEYNRLQLNFDVSYDLAGGIVKPLVGIQLSHLWLDDYSFESYDVTYPDGTVNVVTEGPSQLREDCLHGTATGCRNGQWDNYIKVGIAVDTRDFPPDPTNGIFFQVAGEFSMKWLGSAENYGRLTTNLSGYYNVLKNTSAKLPLVIAGRFMYNYQFSSPPFYSMDTIARTDFDQKGLGGYHTIRGYPLDRFVTPSALLFNADLRWSFLQFDFWGTEPEVDGRAVL